MARRYWPISSAWTACLGLLGTPELGYKVAFCERDLAIYTTVLLAGLGYARMRGRLNGLSLTATPS